MTRSCSAAGDVEVRRVRSDAGGVCVVVAVGARVVETAAAAAADGDAVACGGGKGTRCSSCSGCGSCTNARDTRVLVVSDGHCTCAKFEIEHTNTVSRYQRLSSCCTDIDIQNTAHIGVDRYLERINTTYASLKFRVMLLTYSLLMDKV